MESAGLLPPPRGLLTFLSYESLAHIHVDCCSSRPSGSRSLGTFTG